MCTHAEDYTALATLFRTFVWPPSEVGEPFPAHRFAAFAHLKCFGSVASGAAADVAKHQALLAQAYPGAQAQGQGQGQHVHGASQPASSQESAGSSSECVAVHTPTAAVYVMTRLLLSAPYTTQLPRPLLSH